MQNATTYPVMETFTSVQGEGAFTGVPSFFIRLGGCDVGCVWCDVKESWTIDESQYMSISSIVDEVLSVGANFVVITGGEPTMHSLSALVDSLHENHIEVAIETAGVHPLDAAIDWYCFSPKKFKKPIEEAYEKANELKVVINHPSDIAWAEEHAQKVVNSKRLNSPNRAG